MGVIENEQKNHKAQMIRSDAGGKVEVICPKNSSRNVNQSKEDSFVVCRCCHTGVSCAVDNLGRLVVKGKKKNCT